MPGESFDWMAEERFQCRAPDGKLFAVLVRLTAPELVDDRKEGLHPYYRCQLGLEPLAKDRWIAGGSTFQALCLSLDYLRKVFKVFVAEGGRVYWGDSTDSVVDLDSSWFAPMLETSKIGLKLSGE